MIREYLEKDLPDIENLGLELHEKFKFKLDLFSKCYVYEINNKIVGFIIYSIIYDRAELVDIIVSKNYRNKGIATKLIKYMINDCLNCSNITLEVNINNTPAIELYKKNGFKVISVRKNYYKSEDAYLMER